MPEKKVLLYSSFIGSGHKKAAEAVQAAINEEFPDVRVRLENFFESAHSGIAGIMNRIYFKLLQSSPKSWGYLYDPREGKAKIAEMIGIRGLFEGIKVKESMDCLFDAQSEKDLKDVLKDFPHDLIGMRELLQLLGSKPEVAEKIYDEQRDKIIFPYSLIGNKLRMLKDMANYLLFKTHNLVKEYNPDVIVCTQVQPCMFVAKLKEKKLLSNPLIAVTTDFGVHSYWIRNGVDAFVVADGEMSDILLARGIAKESIHEYGIPIDKKFSSQKDKSGMRGKIGIAPDKFTVLFMGGGTGFLTDTSEVIRVCQNRKLPIQILFVAGENSELKDKMEQIRKKTDIPVFVYGFVDNIEELMGASDLIVTKPGGLSVTESMVSCLPMILVKVIEGQEENNLRFLLKKEVALEAVGGRQIGKLICKLYDNPGKLDELKMRMRGMVHPDSSSNTAKLVNSYINR